MFYTKSVLNVCFALYRCAYRGAVRVPLLADRTTRSARGLFADVQPRDDIEISLRGNAFEIVQQSPASTHERKETPPGGGVLLETLHVSRERVDPAGQDGNLNFRRTGIAIGLTMLFDQLLLFFLGDRHRAVTSVTCAYRRGPCGARGQTNLARHRWVGISFLVGPTALLFCEVDRIQ